VERAGLGAGSPAGPGSMRLCSRLPGGPLSVVGFSDKYYPPLPPPPNGQCHRSFNIFEVPPGPDRVGYSKNCLGNTAYGLLPKRTMGGGGSQWGKEGDKR
jgi:hypothetical protein